MYPTCVSAQYPSIDLLIVLDSDNSYGSTAHNRIKETIKNIIARTNPFFNPTQIRVSFLQYGNQGSAGVFRFSQLTNTVDILSAIDNVPLLNGSGADIKPALVQAINFLEGTSTTSVKQVFWFTDQTWWEDVNLETNRLQQLATVYAFGVDTDSIPSNSPEQIPLLNALSSDISGLQTLFYHQGFSQLLQNSVSIADQMRAEYDALCNSDTTVSHFPNCVSSAQPEIDLLLVFENDNSFGNAAFTRMIDGMKLFVQNINVNSNPTKFRISLLQHGSETSQGVFRFQRRTSESTILSGIDSLTHIWGSGPNWEVTVDQIITFLDDDSKFFYDTSVKHVVFFTDNQAVGNYPDLDLYAHRLQQIATVYAVGIDGDAETVDDWKVTELVNLLGSGPLWKNGNELVTGYEYTGFLPFKNDATQLSQTIRSGYDRYCNSDTTA